MDFLHLGTAVVAVVGFAAMFIAGPAQQALKEKAEADFDKNVKKTEIASIVMLIAGIAQGVLGGFAVIYPGGLSIHGLIISVVIAYVLIDAGRRARKVAKQALQGKK